jgi:hypothetical protein
MEQLCSFIRVGCMHRLPSNMDKQIMKEISFEAPSQDVKKADLLFASFPSNLTITVSPCTRQLCMALFRMPSNSLPYSISFLSSLLQVTNLEMQMVDVNAPTPEVYLKFEQLSLSAMQHRGVLYIIIGAASVFVALSLTCLHWFFQRRKELQRNSGHRD